MSAGTPALLLATRSDGKLRELEPLFLKAGIPVVHLAGAGIPETRDEENIEVFGTFEANAMAKVRYFLARFPDAPVIADDSGLEVAALDGLPGVRSKRWSGREDLEGQALDDANNLALVTALANQENRSARYVCAAAYMDASRQIVRRGVTSGRILDSPRGRDGFGYDPLFFSSELGKTFGECEPREKERVSHRGRAFRALISALRESQGPASREEILDDTPSSDNSR